MRFIFTLLLFLSTLGVSAQTTCVDPLACNFTEFGECEFLDDNGFPCVTEGCAITGACNFDPEADINDGSCEFTSCLGCTDEAACNYDSEAVYLDLSCIYFVDCNGVCGGDWIEDECGNCFEQVFQTETLEFSNCTAFGRMGPSQAQCDLEYGNISVSVDSGVQIFVVPQSGLYRITALGSQGGSTIDGQYFGGLGASMSGDFSLNQGDTLHVLVGQQGVAAGFGSGGGGGTFVTRVEYGENILTDVEILLIAGGGGGATSYTGFDGEPGLIGANGGDSNVPNGGACESNGFGGSNGLGGGAGCAGGGGGFYSDGDSGTHEAQGGYAYLNGGFGGDATYQGDFTFGGFGGGGAGSPGNGYGGGGGGFSGGGGGSWEPAGNGGGGGSFNAGVNQTNEPGVRWGDGRVFITYEAITLGPSCELGCIAEAACNFNPEATNDDGSCDFCFCGPGTEYSIDEGQCLVVGGGSDINGDGCTNLNDLLDLLAGYGSCID